MWPVNMALVAPDVTPPAPEVPGVLDDIEQWAYVDSCASGGRQLLYRTPPGAVMPSGPVRILLYGFVKAHRLSGLGSWGG